MLLIKRSVPFVQPKRCLFLSPEEKGPFCVLESNCADSLCPGRIETEALCAPHLTDPGSTVSWSVMGNRHPALRQETRTFLVQVIRCFLAGVHPRVEPEVAALISDSCHSANTKEKQQDSHGYS